MIDSLSGQPEPRALEIITAALKSAQQMGEQGDWAFDETDSDNLLRDLTAVFLAAGWLPPETLEQVGWMDWRYGFHPMYATFRGVGAVPVYCRAAGWTPPEGEKT